MFAQPDGLAHVLTAGCFSENMLVEYAEARLGAEVRASVNRHLATCSDCRGMLSALAGAQVTVPPTGMLAPPSIPPSPAAAITDSPMSQRFQILRKLGQGGMGVVYEALDRHHNSRVALKTLRSLNPDALLRFKNEFRALQDLQHTNLVRLGELLEENGQWWFTMELLQGVDFLTYVREAPQQGLAEEARIRSMGQAETLPPPAERTGLPANSPVVAASPALPSAAAPESRLRDALLQLAEGLHALHRANKVHRDIKPQNVLVTASGRVVILDFGLITDRAQVDSAVVGTFAYMAPEQAAAEPAGPAADWYCVGVMLFEALTGRLPNQESLLELRTSQSPPPSALIPSVPPDLDALCSEMLNPDASQRPQGDAILARLRKATTLGGEKPQPALALSAAPHPFVGRQAELLSLHEAFAQSRAGHAALLLIEGESGVGKSALVHHFTKRLQTETSDAVVLGGRCY